MKLGGVEVAFNSAHSISQSFEPISAEIVHRMSDGSAVKQTAWSGKMRISTRGDGKIPLALLDLDYSGMLVLDCCSPLSVFSASTALTLPDDWSYDGDEYAAWRYDVSLVGHAIVSGMLRQAAISSIVDNDVTLTSVSGASGYQLSYWPRYCVFASRPQESGSGRGYPGRSWSLIAEQV